MSNSPAEENHPSSLGKVFDGPEEKKIGFLEQTIDEFVKVQEEEPEIQKGKIPKAAYEEGQEIPCEWLTIGEYLRERSKWPFPDYNKEPKPFPIKGYPTRVCTSTSDTDSYSDSDSEAIAEEESEIQNEKSPKDTGQEPEIQPKAAYEEGQEIPCVGLTIGEYLKERSKWPFPDYSKEPKPFPIKVYPTRVYTSTSDTDSYSGSDSDAITEEESEIQNEKSLKDTGQEPEIQPNVASEQDKTPAEPIDERLYLDFDSETKANKPVAVELAESSTTELISKHIVPASSVLVRHGTKRPTEGGDKDCKRAKEMASQTGVAGKETTDDENEGGGSLMSI